MKQLLFLLLTTFGLLGMFSCTSNNSGVMRIVDERDSLKVVNANLAQELSDWNEMAETFNSVMDSIAAGEGMIFFNNGDKPLKKKEILSNIDRFEEILAVQKDKIAALEAKLVSSGDNRNTSKLIAQLKRQIEEKDQQIVDLRKEVESNKVDIARLRRQVDEQKERLEQQDSEIENLANVNKVQDEIINKGYVMIATKKELRKRDITSMWNKQPKNVADNLSYFTPVDIRNWNEITFEAKKATILSDMPKSSYILRQSNKRLYTLQILDATSFWSATNYLIIQTD